jgi:predicted short-subunit dehydrogenase-like oxidoreductase (DUF2520 family)
MAAGTPAISAEPRIGFIGPGRVGATLAEAFHTIGLSVVSVFGRDAERARTLAARIPGLTAAPSPQSVADSAALVFITVTDDAIDQVCADVRWRANHAVVHCSGARELDALTTAQQAGARVGSFHPLQMFATPAAALATLPGCTVAIEGEASLAEFLHRTAVALGCRPIRLPAGHRAMYHASAYYVGPFLIALMQEAAAIWRELGLSEREAIDALAPLLHGTVGAVMEGGLAAGMGGCVARGDVGTVERHVAALDAFAPEMGALYRQLARRTIPLGLARGTLSPAAGDRIRAALDTLPFERKED